VPAAGGDEGPAVLDRHAILGLDHLMGAGARQRFGQAGGELGRHVLDDEDGQAGAPAQRRQHLHQRLGATGRDPDQDRLGDAGAGRDGGGARRNRGQRCGARPRRRRGYRRAGGRGGARTQRRQARGAAADATTRGAGADTGAELLAQRRHVLVIPFGGGLGDEVERPQGEGLDGQLGTLAGERAEHDHPGVDARLGQRLEGGDAVHLRHLDIEGDDVGGVGAQPLDRLGAIALRAHHLDLGVAGKGVAHRGAEHPAVIDDQNADGLVGHGRLGRGWAAPGRRSSGGSLASARPRGIRAG
jgi:hypothetical protein